jgi:predicted nuclease of predicted toxin-antitoxin system
VKVLVDVNLAPAWASFLAGEGIESEHWTAIGDPRASDEEVLRYAREHGYVVFTHDLDFGTLLALTRARGPSVVQVRSQKVLPSDIGPLVVRALKAHATALEAGALVTLDELSARVRILPIH